ncbi:hypothetical protein WDW86_00845 [Bdellovibrionota bacterium FG-2]
MAPLSVRLTSEEITGICRAVLKCLPTQVLRISLFGSRTDMQKRGGDIDLWIELDQLCSDPALVGRQLRLAIEDEIGEQKIDLKISGPFEKIKDPQLKAFYQIILPTKADLWSRNPTSLS